MYKVFKSVTVKLPSSAHNPQNVFVTLVLRLQAQVRAVPAPPRTPPLGWTLTGLGDSGALVGTGARGPSFPGVLWGTGPLTCSVYGAAHSVLVSSGPLGAGPWAQPGVPGGRQAGSAAPTESPEGSESRCGWEGARSQWGLRVCRGRASRGALRCPPVLCAVSPEAVGTHEVAVWERGPGPPLCPSLRLGPAPWPCCPGRPSQSS